MCQSLLANQEYFDLLYEYEYGLNQHKNMITDTEDKYDMLFFYFLLLSQKYVA